MNTVVELNGVTIDLMTKEPPFFLAGRGYIHLAQTVGKCRGADLSKFLGQELYGEEIIGVESWRIDDMSDRPIGILLRKKVW